MILKMPPTKSNLFKLQSELKFARDGYELLDRKREVLIMEMMQVIHGISHLQRKLNTALQQAYEDLYEAYVEMGSEEIERANFAFREPLRINMKEHTVMGVMLPELSLESAPGKVEIGLLGTSGSFDSAVESFSAVVPLLLEYAQAALTLSRLAKEVQKTQRRVNALENITIPNASDTIKFISESLEEGERQSFFQRKKVKMNLQK
ncbi:V-type ATP synthase subunit D [bacterium]|nr:V-type ATP synthase subunit D [bacterium]